MFDSITHFEVTGPSFALGAVTGMTYGIIAVGLVLVYRSSRIINFAQGAIGALGASLAGVAVVEWGVSYWLAFPLALIVSGFAGAASDVVVIRRLNNAPAVIGVVATLGLAQVLLLFSSIINTSAGQGAQFPSPPGFPDFDLGPLRVTTAYSAMMILTPLIVIGLVLFFRRGWFGLAMRASSINVEAAELTGVNAKRMTTLAWGISGALAAYTAILILPTRGFTGGDFLGPGLLLRALTAAVIARMTSLTVAMVAGIGVGILESLLLWNYPDGSLVEAVLFVIILVALLLQRARYDRRDAKGTWSVIRDWLPLPDSYRKIFLIRNLRWIVFFALFGFALDPAPVDLEFERGVVHAHRGHDGRRVLDGHRRGTQRTALVGAIPARGRGWRRVVQDHRHDWDLRPRLHRGRSGRGGRRAADRHPCAADPGPDACGHDAGLRDRDVRLGVPAAVDDRLRRVPGLPVDFRPGVRRRQVVLPARARGVPHRAVLRPERVEERPRSTHACRARQRGHRPRVHGEPHDREAAGIRRRRLPRRTGWVGVRRVGHAADLRRFPGATKHRRRRGRGAWRSRPADGAAHRPAVHRRHPRDPQHLRHPTGSTNCRCSRRPPARFIVVQFPGGFAVGIGDVPHRIADAIARRHGLDPEVEWDIEAAESGPARPRLTLLPPTPRREPCVAR